MSSQTSPAIQRLPVVMSRTGLGRSSLYAAIKRGDFPVPVKIGARAVGFIAQEVDAWIAAKVAKRTENSR